MKNIKKQDVGVFSDEKRNLVDLIDETSKSVRKLLEETRETVKNYTFINSNKLNTK